MWMGIRDEHPTLVPEAEAITWDMESPSHPLLRPEVISTPVTVMATPLLTAVIEAEELPPPLLQDPSLIEAHMYSF